MLRENVREAVLSVPGVTEVSVEEGWHLPWSRDMIEPDVQDMMRVNGIQV
jgi:metal-sulfur cluster biosynthetic enzyme